MLRHEVEELSPPLPECSPERYRLPGLALRLEHQDLDELAGTIGEYYRDIPSTIKRNLPYIPEERIALEGVLVFVDSCVPFSGNKKRNINLEPARVARARAFDIINSECLSLYDLDDLQQEARIAADAAMRNYKPELGSNLLVLIARRTSAHFQHMYRKSIMGGFVSSGRGPRTSQAGEQSLSDLIDDAACHSKEHGWSEEVTTLQKHPQHYKKIPLDRSSGAYKVADQNSQLDEELHGGAAKLSDVFSLAEDLGVKLTDRQKQLLCLHFELGFTLEEIGQKLNPPISPQSVGQTVLRAIAKLSTVKDTLRRELGY